MINATNIPEQLRTKYLLDNGIKGCFLAKNWYENGKQYYEVFEGKEDFTGFKAGEFKLKRQALAFIYEWRKATGLPRFNNFNC